MDHYNPRGPDKLAGWTPPKREDPFTNEEVRRHILAALSRLRQALDQSFYIPDHAGAETVHHKPARIVESQIHEARRILYITANNLHLPEEKPKCDCDARIGEGCSICCPNGTWTPP
jgi:hypothetical protein